MLHVPWILTSAFVAFALIGRAPVMAASVSPDYYGHSKTVKSALPVPVPVAAPQAGGRDDNVRADTYLFLGQDNLFFNENAVSGSGLVPAGGGMELTPLRPTAKPDRPVID